jgi:hypothetical protein
MNSNGLDEQNEYNITIQWLESHGKLKLSQIERNNEVFYRAIFKSNDSEEEITLKEPDLKLLTIHVYKEAS